MKASTRAILDMMRAIVSADIDDFQFGTTGIIVNGALGSLLAGMIGARRLTAQSRMLR